MRRQTSWITLATLLACASPGAQAQDAPGPASRGLTAFVGAGKGSASLVCRFCASDGLGSFAGTLGVTNRFRRGMRLGGELHWWLQASGGVTRAVLGAMPTVQLYPSASGRFFIKAGLGVARFQASSDEEELRTESLVGLLGLGYELRILEHAVVPYLSWMSGSGGSMRLNGALVTNQGGVALLQYGLALAVR